MRQIVKPASTVQEVVSIMARSKTRSLMVQSLQTLIDLKVRKDNSFLICVSEWQARHSSGAPIFKPIPFKRKAFGGSGDDRPQWGGCFLCKEQRHIARNCPRKVTYQDKEKAYSGERNSSDRPKPVPRSMKCYNCHEFGHESPECPKTRPSVKRVGLETTQPRLLKPNECVVRIMNVQCIMTVDTGAEVTLIPKELFPCQCFTGEEQPIKGVDEMGNRIIGDRVCVQLQVLV